MGDDSSLGLVTLMIISALGEGVDAEGKASIVEVAMPFAKFAEGLKDISGGGHNIWNIGFALIGGDVLSFGV